MATGFNINEFKSTIDSAGLMRNNKFRIQFTPPKILIESPLLNSTSKNTTANIGFWCDSANIPGIMLNAVENRRYGYGHVEKQPVSGVFNDMNLSILADKSMQNHKLFTDWISNIYSFDIAGGNGSASFGYPTGIGDTLRYPMLLSYKNEYTVDLIIECYSDTGKMQAAFTCVDAYPIALGDIQLNWNDTNSVARIPVTFTYSSWFSSN